MASGCAEAEIPEDASPAESEAVATGPRTTYCDAIQRATVSNGALEAGADGVWSPGEHAVLDLTLTNTGSADDQRALTAYPAVRITFDPPIGSLLSATGEDVITSTGTLPPGTPTLVRFRVEAQASVALGTKVTITAAMADNRSPFDHCSADGPPLRFSTVIGAAPAR
jgi:hypothetical protein